MFKQHMSFVDIVIETQQEPELIRKLWSEYCAGFLSTVAAHDEIEREHKAEIRALDASLEKKRRES